MKTILATGGFDPLHRGHIAYLRQARALGDRLIVGVNSDAWLMRKKGRAFLPWLERAEIVDNLKMVDHVVEFDDNDGSARAAIHTVRRMYPDDEIVFANGGDRTDKNIPEMDVADPKLQFVFGVGGFDKTNSSSWILEEWKSPRSARPWGYYRVLHEDRPQVKVKELTVDSGMCLSMQRHSDRAEFWFVSQGRASVYTVNPASTDVEHLGYFDKFDFLHIQCGQWHRLCNESDQPLKIVEIQYGNRCEETDIERRS